MNPGLIIRGSDGGFLVWETGDYLVFAKKVTSSDVTNYGTGTNTGGITWIQYDFTLPSSVGDTNYVVPFVYTGSYYAGITRLEKTGTRAWRLDLHAYDNQNAKNTINIYIFIPTSQSGVSSTGYGFKVKNASGNVVFDSGSSSPLYAKGSCDVSNAYTSSDLSYGDSGLHHTTSTAHGISGLSKPAGVVVLSGAALEMQQFNYGCSGVSSRYAVNWMLLLTSVTSTACVTGWTSNGFKEYMAAQSNFYKCFFLPINSDSYFSKDSYTTAIIDGADYD